MRKGPAAHLAVIVQRFVNAEIDAPEMLDKAQKLLGPGVDVTEKLLAGLAEGGVPLQLPPPRRSLSKRFAQFANGEIAYTELDLWLFTVAQIGQISAQGRAEDPEIELLRAVVEWSQPWDDEAKRPGNKLFLGMSSILKNIADPAECLATLEAALASDREG